MNNRKVAFRGVRKGAYLTRRVASKAATFAGRVENKSTRIINGTDPTIQIHKKILQEQVMAEALPEVTPLHPALPYANRKACVNLMIPSLQNSSFFGGTATALILGAKLANEKDMPFRVVETLKHGKASIEQLHEFLKSAGVKLNKNDISMLNVAGRKYDHYGYVDIHPNDLFIASAWWDAHLLNELPLNNKFIYLIQDFEPIFYNNSDQYVLAEETYNKKSFVPVFNTKLMHDFMQEKGYAGIPKEALHFEPAVNIGKRTGYSEPKPAGEAKRLFIYGRPSVHRNLYHRALSVVDQAFATGALRAKEWDVYMAGQDNIADILLDCGVTVKNLGKMSLDEYYGFARTVDLSLSLMMAPHPSYPPLEMASIGSGVVTTAYSNKQDLSGYSKNIYVSDSSVESLINNLKHASGLSHEERLKNAKSASIPSDWHEALDPVVKALSSSL